MISYSVSPGKPLTGSLTLPGDKSISHRSVIFGSIAKGRSVIEDILLSEDVWMTINAFRTCGIDIRQDGSELTIEGKGLGGLQKPHSDIYCGNSGTSLRLLTGLFAAQQFPSRFTGDESLSTRPMLRVVEPLRQMGANITLSDNNSLPVSITPSERLSPIVWKLPVASAQVTSAILLAGLYAVGKTTVVEPELTRNHTMNFLDAFGCPVERDSGRISITGGSQLTGQRIQVPADFSSAAFYIVAATVTPGSDLTLKGVGVNPTRTGLLDVLKSMGAKVELMNAREVGPEPVADIRVQCADSLEGTVVNPDLIPKMIDEIPILAVAAACADGVTVISGCEELRVKESDRIHSVTTGLANIGISVSERHDGFVIQGSKRSGGTVDSFGDHRIAMAFAIAGSVSETGVEVMNCDCVNTSFPGFADIARTAGMNIVESGTGK
ncbi:MAG: 3-phosphoshikimate 1-carboxyvinyltransferase [Acidiferrobacterales bacterium]|nr:3-phosphoshikimate 1-carboxyvinyltransferase [Acidiferrobacterales bacterium]